MSSFQQVFGSKPSVHVSAPGRVNLLGEHTDYNGGFVFPAPLPYQTHIWASKSEDIEAFAERFSEHKACPLDALPARDWLDYVAGSVWALRKNGYNVGGIRAYIGSEIPAVGGLSSSAALEVATLRAMRSLYDLNISDIQIAQIAQQAEVEFVGVRCGIMDQMASSVGRAGHALFLDTQSLESRLAPLPVGHKIVVVDSGIPRRLAESGYNTRRAECEEACSLLGIRTLREADLSFMPQIEKLPQPLNRRARHVVTENARVLEGVRVLQGGNFKRFGELMVASHNSLRDDYEVSLPELDNLVAIMMRHGALGARLTGAGFGGATVALVEETKYEAFKVGVAGDYPLAQFY